MVYLVYRQGMVWPDTVRPSEASRGLVWRGKDFEEDE